MTATEVAAAAAFLVARDACLQDASLSPSEEKAMVCDGFPAIRDGDDVKIAGVNISLLGIDTCKLGQTALRAHLAKA